MEKQLKILIAELQSYEKSLNFNMAGYTQMLPDGKEHFCCKICGHSPALLIQRLELLLPDDAKEKYLREAILETPEERKETREERHKRLSDRWDEL